MNLDQAPVEHNQDLGTPWLPSTGDANSYNDRPDESFQPGGLFGKHCFRRVDLPEIVFTFRPAVQLTCYTMPQAILVKKHSGEKQPFSEKKLIQSVMRAGATEEIAHAVTEAVKPYLYDGITTRDIYRKAFQILRRRMRSLAARYSLKNAIMELGPSGYPFEKFVGELFRKQGFAVKTGLTVPGRCVQHEIDVLAEKNGLTVMVECKYRNDQGKISNVQVPLYVHSRFRDIESRWSENPDNRGKKFQGWIVTNTRFSGDAENYGTCSGMHLLSWSFPEKNNLRTLVEKYALFPVTALTGLTRKQKQALLGKDIILVDHLCNRPEVLEEFQLTEKKRDEILQEAGNLCAIGQLL